MITLQTIKRKMRPGMSFSYGELCKALRDEVKSGNSRMAQLKEWRRYIDFDLNDRVYTITRIHNHVLPKHDATKPETLNIVDRDGVKFQRGKYSYKIGYLLQDYLKDKPEQTAVFTKRQILTGIGLTADEMFTNGTTLKLTKEFSLTTKQVHAMRYLLYKEANGVLKNFKASSWGRCFSFEAFYCGKRKWEPGVYNLEKAHPEVIKFFQDNYIYSKKIEYIKNEDGYLETYLPITAGGYDGIIYSNGFRNYMLKHMGLKYFFIAYRIKQMSPLPYVEVDLNAAVRENNTNFNDGCRKNLQKHFSRLSEQQLDGFLKKNVIPDLHKTALYWTDISKSLDFYEDFEEIQI